MKKNMILNSLQIQQKIKRMAYELWEQNHDQKKITIVGIAPGGGAILAHNLGDLLTEISPLEVEVLEMKVNKKQPESDVALSLDKDLTKQTVVLVDDVANSGRTLLYALRPLLKQFPRKIQIAVLVNRHHKNFPVVPDYIGQSVSTTLQDHIDVIYQKDKITGAYLV